MSLNLLVKRMNSGSYTGKYILGAASSPTSDFNLECTTTGQGRRRVEQRILEQRSSAGNQKATSAAVSGDFSANRPNKSPVCGGKRHANVKGTTEKVQVGVLCEGEISGGSSNVRNMTCARDDERFGDNAHKEHNNVRLSHAREKIARVNACEVRCTVGTTRRLQGNRQFL